MSKTPISFVIALTVFYGLMVFVIFEAFRTHKFAGLTLLVPFCFIIYDYTIRMEYNPIHRNPNFCAMDGTISVVESKLTPLQGGKSMITISTKKDYVPKDKWYRMGGINGLMSHLAGKVTMDIVDDTWRFVPIVGEHLGAKEGAFIYLGSLSGKPVVNINDYLIRRLDEMESLVRTQETVYERAKQLANSMARSNNLDMLEVQKQFSVIMTELSQSLHTQQEHNIGGKGKWQ